MRPVGQSADNVSCLAAVPLRPGVAGEVFGPGACSVQGLVVKAGISSHSHEDRTAGIEVLNSKAIPTFTSRRTNDILAREGKPTATNVFDENELSLAGGRLEIFHQGPSAWAN